MGRTYIPFTVHAVFSPTHNPPQTMTIIPSNITVYLFANNAHLFFLARSGVVPSSTTTAARDGPSGRLLDTRRNPLLLRSSAHFCFFRGLHPVSREKAHIDGHGESNVGRNKSLSLALWSNEPGKVVIANREKRCAHVHARDFVLPVEAACTSEFLKIHSLPRPFPFFGLDLKDRPGVTADIKLA